MWPRSVIAGEAGNIGKPLENACFRRYGTRMSKVEQIEAEIEKLPPTDYAKLVKWIEARREAEWDRQIEKDASNGKLDKLWNRALKDIKAGRVKPLDEVIDNP